MHFMPLPRSGLLATEATRLAWECLASAGLFGYGSFSCPHQKQKQTNKLAACTDLRENSEGLSF